MLYNIKSKDRGFTIIELLVVIVVIAILATMSAVIYNGIQNRGNDTAIQSDLATFSKKAKVYQSDNGRYPGTQAELLTLKFQPSKNSYETSITGQNNLFYCAYDNTSTSGPAEATSYVISAKSKSGTNFYVSSSGSGTLGTGALNSSNYCTPIGLTFGTNTWATNGYTKSSGVWNANWVL